MRFELPKKTYPIEGSIKTKSWFAIIPIVIGNEIRWLEKVTVESKYKCFDDGICGWSFTKFID